jgi:uncharacterized protein
MMQLFVIFSEPAGSADDRAKVRPEHLAYVVDLERRGVLFAAGPFTDDAGKAQGPGMLIVRASSSVEAAAIASADPFHKGGFRTFRIQPWRLSEGSLSFKIDLSTSRCVLA